MGPPPNTRMNLNCTAMQPGKNYDDYPVQFAEQDWSKVPVGGPTTQESAGDSNLLTPTQRTSNSLSKQGNVSGTFNTIPPTKPIGTCTTYFYNTVNVSGLTKKQRKKVKGKFNMLINNNINLDEAGKLCLMPWPEIFARVPTLEPTKEFAYLKPKTEVLQEKAPKIQVVNIEKLKAKTAVEPALKPLILTSEASLACNNSATRLVNATETSKAAIPRPLNSSAFNNTFPEQGKISETSNICTPQPRNVGTSNTCPLRSGHPSGPSNSSFSNPSSEATNLILPKGLNKGAKRKFLWLIDHGISQEEASKLCLMSWPDILEKIPTLEPPKEKAHLKRKPDEELQAPAKKAPNIFNEVASKQAPIASKDAQVPAQKPLSEGQENLILRSEERNPLRVGIRNVKPMNADQMKSVHSHLLTAISEQFSDGTGPEFLGYTHKAGWVLVTCVDQKSRDWLMQEVQYLEPWPGAILSIIPEQELPNIPMVVVTLPSSEVASTQEALHLLKVQNKGLNTEFWRVLHERVDKTRRVVTFNIDEGSLAVLRAKDNVAFLGFQMVTFRIKAVGSQFISSANQNKVPATPNVSTDNSAKQDTGNLKKTDAGSNKERFKEPSSFGAKECPQPQSAGGRVAAPAWVSQNIETQSGRNPLALGAKREAARKGLLPTPNVPTLQNKGGALPIMQESPIRSPFPQTNKEIGHVAPLYSTGEHILETAAVMGGVQPVIEHSQCIRTPLTHDQKGGWFKSSSLTKRLSQPAKGNNEVRHIQESLTGTSFRQREVLGTSTSTRKEPPTSGLGQKLYGTGEDNRQIHGVQRLECRTLFVQEVDKKGPQDAFFVNTAKPGIPQPSNQKKECPSIPNRSAGFSANNREGFAALPKERLASQADSASRPKYDTRQTVQLSGVIDLTEDDQYAPQARMTHNGQSNSATNCGNASTEAYSHADQNSWKREISAAGLTTQTTGCAAIPIIQNSITHGGQIFGQISNHVSSQPNWTMATPMYGHPNNGWNSQNSQSGIAMTQDRSETVTEPYQNSLAQPTNQVLSMDESRSIGAKSESMDISPTSSRDRDSPEEGGFNTWIIQDAESFAASTLNTQTSSQPVEVVPPSTGYGDQINESHHWSSYTQESRLTTDNYRSSRSRSPESSNHKDRIGDDRKRHRSPYTQENSVTTERFLEEPSRSDRSPKSDYRDQIDDREKYRSPSTQKIRAETERYRDGTSRSDTSPQGDFLARIDDGPSRLVGPPRSDRLPPRGIRDRIDNGPSSRDGLPRSNRSPPRGYTNRIDEGLERRGGPPKSEKSPPRGHRDLIVDGAERRGGPLRSQRSPPRGHRDRIVESFERRGGPPRSERSPPRGHRDRIVEGLERRGGPPRSERSPPRSHRDRIVEDVERRGGPPRSEKSPPRGHRDRIVEGVERRGGPPRSERSPPRGRRDRIVEGVERRGGPPRSERSPPRGHRDRIVESVERWGGPPSSVRSPPRGHRDRIVEGVERRGGPPWSVRSPPRGYRGIGEGPERRVGPLRSRRSPQRDSYRDRSVDSNRPLTTNGRGRRSEANPYCR